ncbi:MAG TPA: PH domain-containing protein [Phycisphaerae bacterium]|jgi:hypothetical protein|nr:PH domain-containing protein [Phycisphaerae bacterium]
MDYELKCICGHRFILADDALKRPVHCPACGQRLTPVVQNLSAVPPSVTATPASTPVLEALPAGEAEPTKRCPFCGEVILAIAKKCKHCGEFLDRAPLSPGETASGTTAATTAANAEPVYTLNISQWDNVWRFIILFTAWIIITGILWIPGLRQYLAVGSLGALVFAGFIGWYFYLRAKSTHIRIYPLRIDVETGILSKQLESLELFRVNDTEFKQTFLERIIGIGTIHLKTSDTTDEPDLTLFQIPRAREVYKYLQTQIPLAAKQRGAIYMEK